MNTPWMISCLLFGSFSSILCIFHPETSFKTKYRESTRDEAKWDVPSQLRSAEEKRGFFWTECPKLYQRFSVNHVYCREPTCITSKDGVTEEDKGIILDMYNGLRSQLAIGGINKYRQLPPAANMMELEWDNELAGIAQAEANLCARTFIRPSERAVENFPVGHFALKIPEEKVQWKAILNLFENETRFFYPVYGTPYLHLPGYYNFVQATWAKTWKIGCGFAAFKEKEIYESYYICNYGPGGNKHEETHYDEGKPCSQCPKNTECSKDYPGLCKSKTTDGPQIERLPLEESILYCDFSDDDPKQCRDMQFDEKFSTGHIYSGDYKTLVLKGGEAAFIKFQGAENTVGRCPFLYIRFGPNNAKDAKKATGDTPLTVYLYTNYDKSNDYYGVDLPYMKENTDWFYYLYRQDWSNKKQLKFVIKLSAGAVPYYVEIKALGIKRGRCKSSFEK